ncbi:MAG TPA: hypothetical protein VGG33_25650 [Polyangia bacterium]
MATESSVVVALKEVRRLEIERQRREEDARRLAQEEEVRALNEERASVQYGPGMAPFNTNGWEANGSDSGSYGRPVHRTSEVMPVQSSSASQNGFLSPQSYVSQTPPAWEGPDFASDRPRKAKSSFRAVVFTLLFCGGAAGAGFWRLNQDFNARVTAAESGRLRAEDARNQAVAERSKLEQELKLKNTELETKLAAVNAKAAAASNALALAAAARPAAAAPLSAGRVSRGYRRGRGFSRASLAAKAQIAAAKAAPKPIAAPPAAPSPKVAKKKAFTDDPLGGLRL